MFWKCHYDNFAPDRNFFESRKFMKFHIAPFLRFCLGILFVVTFINIAPAQMGSNDRDMALGMLEQARDEVKKNYFDPQFRGVDLEKVFQESRAAIKGAKTRDEMMLIIAQFMSNLDDSHTWFSPPSRAADLDYGWQLQIIGNDCYVIAVKPKSDAEAKGLKVGDKVVSVDGFLIVRENIWQLNHRYHYLMPSSQVRFVVLSPGDAKPHVVDVATKISRTAGTIDPRAWYTKALRKEWDVGRKEYTYEFGNKDLMIWRMSSFAFATALADYDHLDDARKHISIMMGKAREFKNLILDLRGNPGGFVAAEKHMVGHFFDRDVKIGDHKMRKETEELIAKTQGGDIFKGNLIVLIDSKSASAAEIFARIVQLEKRGKVIGDRSAGAVMTSRGFPMRAGTASNVLFFGASITIGDLIMTDGKSLEKIGVIPNELKLPSGKDLAEFKDPVLSYAAKFAGIDISPEKAGTMFPIEWPKL